MHARLRGSKRSLTLYKYINKTLIPSLADEIAEPHPDMNIKVAAFTVSEKSSNICKQNGHALMIKVQYMSKWCNLYNKKSQTFKYD